LRESYTQCGKTYKGESMKQMFAVVTTLVALTGISPLKAETSKPERSFVPPVISTEPGESNAQVVLYVDGLDPIHAFTMSIQDILDPAASLGVPIRFMRQGKGRGPMIFLPGGDEFQNWLIMNIIGDFEAPANSRIEFHVAGDAKASCGGMPGGVRCTMNRMDGRYPLLLQTIEGLSADPKATFTKLVNGQYYGKVPIPAKPR
jgi:hypothetical protein